MTKTLIEKIITNPIYPKIGIFFFILIVLMDIFQPFFDSEIKYEHRVKRKVINDNKIISTYDKIIIAETGLFKISSPSLKERALFRTNETSSITTSLSYLIILIILFKSSDKLLFGDKFYFKKKSWVLLLKIGFILIIFSAINMLKDPIVNSHIKGITNSEYISDEKFTHWAQFWAGLLFTNLSIVFKKAFELQQEQDLTV